MKVGDYIIKPDGSSEVAAWRITGIYLGGVGYESCVGLVRMNKKEPSAHGLTVGEMLAPLELVEPYLVEVRSHD